MSDYELLMVVLGIFGLQISSGGLIVALLIFLVPRNSKQK